MENIKLFTLCLVISVITAVNNSCRDKVCASWEQRADTILIKCNYCEISNILVIDSPLADGIAQCDFSGYHSVKKTKIILCKVESPYKDNYIIENDPNNTVVVLHVSLNENEGGKWRCRHGHYGESSTVIVQVITGHDCWSDAIHFGFVGFGVAVFVYLVWWKCLSAIVKKELDCSCYKIICKCLLDISQKKKDYGKHIEDLFKRMLSCCGILYITSLESWTDIFLNKSKQSCCIESEKLKKIKESIKMSLSLAVGLIGIIVLGHYDRKPCTLAKLVSCLCGVITGVNAVLICKYCKEGRDENTTNRTDGKSDAPAGTPITAHAILNINSDSNDRTSNASDGISGRDENTTNQTDGKSDVPAGSQITTKAIIHMDRGENYRTSKANDKISVEDGMPERVKEGQQPNENDPLMEHADFN